MRAATGGMPLAEKLLTPWLRRAMNIYYCGTQSLWTWYTEQVTKVKNTAQGLQYYMASASGGWQKHVAELLRNNLVDEVNLKRCELFHDHLEIPVPVQEQSAGLMLEFTTRLAGNRCFSCAHFDAPPFCYAGLFSQSETVKARVARSMKNHLRIMMLLEDNRYKDNQIATLLDDMLDVFTPAVRLMFIAFEKDDWDFRSPAGMKILAGFLAGLPDTKVVEDTHQHLRDLRRRARYMVCSKISRTQACVDAGILEARGLRHEKVTKSEFVAKFRKFSNKVPKKHSKFLARHHKMSEPWSEIMGDRTWTSKTPEASRSSYAAWHWAVEWCSGVAPRPPIESPRLSSIAGDNCVLRSSEGQCYFCLGSCDWAASACLLKAIGNYSELDGEPLAAWSFTDEFVWLHLRIVCGWQVLPHVACSPARFRTLLPGLPVSVCALQSGKPVPLLKHFLSKPIKISFKDLQDVATQAGVDVRGLSSRDNVTRAIARSLLDGQPDDDFVDKAAKMCDAGPESFKIDPWTELAYDGLDPDEQKEFRDIKDAIQKHRKKEQLAKYKDDLRKRKATKLTRLKPKSKAKGKGRGRGSAGGSGAATASSAPSDSAALPAAPPASRASSQRNPDVFSWGTGKLQFDLTRRKDGVPGWKVRCPLHAADIGPRGTSLPCSRELSKSALTSARPEIPDGELDDEVVRQLKRWGVDGAVGGSARLPRSEHMSHHLFPRVLPSEKVGTDSQLNEELRAAARALG